MMDIYTLALTLVKAYTLELDRHNFDKAEHK